MAKVKEPLANYIVNNKTPLTNAQAELLKLFTMNISDEDLRDIKLQLTRYFAQKATAEADKIWVEKGWTDNDAQRLLKNIGENRTSESMLNVVLDTNIMLVSVSSRSPFHWVFQSLVEGKYTLSVTTDILSEYEEVIAEEMGFSLAQGVMETLDNLPNVEFVTKYFRWQLISVDDDDNKFVDCDVANNVHYIVTEDKHFNILKRIKFPNVSVINLKQFKKIISESV